ncbi:MAG: 50S ribosome-binding GTPase, partial [Deltaproteobacteria bacterium]|nr:50S ribosome-binding GTPase [Deltaproteobacteria bacterium]
MKIGIVGISGSGKTTIFNALTGSVAEISVYQKGKKDPNLAVVKVPDSRLDRLSSMYNPKKTIYAQVQYVDIGGTVSAREGMESSIDELLKLLHPVDALVHVVRNFDRSGEPPIPQKDLETLESELILTDLIILEKKVERLEKEITKARKGNPEELELLKRAGEILERGKAL